MSELPRPPLQPGASNPADREAEDRRRAELDRVDPLGMLPPRERERMLEAEQAEQDRNEALRPHESDDLQTKMDLARTRYAESSDLVYRFANCVECGRRLTYAGPAANFDRATARCSKHSPPPDEE